MISGGGVGFDDSDMEEEWDRTDFLDPMWEIQQKKSFAAWCNYHLRRLNLNISDITTDFCSGINLLYLLRSLATPNTAGGNEAGRAGPPHVDDVTVISGSAAESVPKPDRGRMRFHKIANLNKAIEYIESKGVQLVNIGPAEILDGNIKMILGMIWTIILRFAIQDITVEEMSAKEGLLLWCQRKTASYRAVKVHNFHNSWKDGQAFCALIHRHRPDLIDMGRVNKLTPLDNLNYAFDVAEKHLEIPRMLDAEDMVNTVKPDERSVMAYVSSYYHVFTGSQKAESAAHKISQVLTQSRENEALMAEYEALAHNLLAWIRKWTDFFHANNPSNSSNSAGIGSDACRQLLLQFSREYLTERPDRVTQKARLDWLLSLITHRLDVQGRPGFVPSEGTEWPVVEREWAGLNALLEAARWERAVERRMRQLERLDALLAKWRALSAAHERWLDGASKVSAPGEAAHANAGGGVRQELMAAVTTQSERNETAADLSNLTRLNARLKRMEATERELGANQNRVEEIVRLAEQINHLSADSADPVDQVNRVTGRIAADWEQLGASVQENKAEVQRQVDSLNRLDQLLLSQARCLNNLMNWLYRAGEQCESVPIVCSTQELQQVLSEHETLKQQLAGGTPRSTLAELDQIGTQIAQWQQQNQHQQPIFNPYTRHKADSAHLEFDHVTQHLIPERHRQLQQLTNECRVVDESKRQLASQLNSMGATHTRSHPQSRPPTHTASGPANQLLRAAEQNMTQLYQMGGSSSSTTTKEVAPSTIILVESGELPEQLHRVRHDVEQSSSAAHQTEWRNAEMERLGLDGDEAEDGTNYDQMDGVAGDQEEDGRAVFDLAVPAWKRQLAGRGGAGKGGVGGSANPRKLQGEQEWRRCFAHFDKKRVGWLDRVQLRACLLALGQISCSTNRPNQQQEDAQFRAACDSMDADNSGRIWLDAFLGYMRQKHGAAASRSMPPTSPATALMSGQQQQQSQHNANLQEMRQAFKSLANDLPYITEEVLLRELPPEQAQFCIKSMPTYRTTAANSTHPTPPPDARDYNTLLASLYAPRTSAQ